MKLENDWGEYAGFCIERLQAQGKQFKTIAEETVGQPVKSIWAVGGVVGDGEFDDTSDVELLFDFENNKAVTESQMTWLQQEIEAVETNVGFIQVFVGQPLSEEKRIRIDK